MSIKLNKFDLTLGRIFHSLLHNCVAIYIANGSIFVRNYDLEVNLKMHIMAIV